MLVSSISSFFNNVFYLIKDGSHRFGRNHRLQILPFGNKLKAISNQPWSVIDFLNLRLYIVATCCPYGRRPPPPPGAKAVNFCNGGMCKKQDEAHPKLRLVIERARCIAPSHGTSVKPFPLYLYIYSFQYIEEKKL